MKGSYLQRVAHMHTELQMKFTQSLFEVNFGKHVFLKVLELIINHLCADKEKIQEKIKVHRKRTSFFLNVCE